MIILGIVALFSISCKRVVKEISLAGEWEIVLDSLDQGISGEWYNRTFTDKIALPGTLCDAGYGIPCTLEPAMEKEIFLNLKRKYDYIGPAWYRKEVVIPRDWENKNILLTLERVIWNSQVWINGKKVEGYNESLSTPHYFELGNYLVPGQKNSITIRIDNSKQHDISVRDLAHAYTNDTQTIWNGILGRISLTAKDRVNIEELHLTPDVDNKRVKVAVKISSSVSGKIVLAVNDPKGKSLPGMEVPIEGSEAVFDYLMDDPLLWDEFNPNIYKVTATLQSGEYTDTRNEIFGFYMKYCG